MSNYNDEGFVDSRQTNYGEDLYHMHGYIGVSAQRRLVREIQEIKEQAPFVRFSLHGNPFNNLNTSCGEVGWVVVDNKYKYVDKHPVTGNPWPAFTPTIAAIAEHFKEGTTVDGKLEVITFQSCLINLYEHRRNDRGIIIESKLGLHRDLTESYKIDIINVSLGDDAIFVLGGTNKEDPTKEIILKSGDVLGMGGADRMRYHGVRKLIPGTSKLLKSPGEGLGIRISLTLRQVYFVKHDDKGDRNQVPPDQEPPENKVQLFLPHVEVPMESLPQAPEPTKVNEDMTTPESLPQEQKKKIDPTKRTTFENTVFTDDNDKGSIKTVTTWPIWKYVNSSESGWIDVAPVVLRNILLTALHPTIPMCIGEVNKDSALAAIAKKKDVSWLLAPFTPKDEKGNTYQLDMASGSRNQGRFTFTTGIINPETKQYNGIGKFYYMTNPEDRWKRIIYGSILHTGCRQIRYGTINYIIVNDELKDKDGNFRDDKTNDRHWHTGDSHMKGSKRLFDLVGLNANEDAEDGAEVVDEGRPFQIRIACQNKWIAKGTIAYNHLLDSTNWDLVIPLSSLKGNKPSEGNYTDKLLMGVVHEAEDRFAKPGWMLWQWFTFKEMEDDGIINRLEEKLQKLKDVSTSMPKLAEFMKRQILDYEAEIQGRDELTSEAEYEDIFLDIVKNDTRGILLLHPYFVSKTIDHLQNMWKNFCTAAGVRFFSVMTMPDESLAHYHFVHEDGRITGRKVFCAPDFKEGEYIVFCNPMRHWGDVQVWENRHEGPFKNAVGIMAVPTKLALTLGRDFDGDFVQLISTKHYPNITKRINSFDPPPHTIKFPKIALSGSLQDIALGSMTDMTGIVSSLLAQTKALGLEYEILEIPAGYNETQPKEMSLIDFLSQELQIAVDSLKSAYPNNKKGLDIVRDYINGKANDQFGEIPFKNVSPWLNSLKKKETFVSKPCDVLANAPDTISKLVRLVNSYWQQFAIKYEDRVPKEYQNALFYHIKSDKEQDRLAIRHTDWYKDVMGKAMDECNALANKGIYTNLPIRVVNNRLRDYRKKLVEDPEKNQFTMESWAAAYWRAANRRESGKASMVFTMFHQEIIEELKNYGDNIPDHIIVYEVNKNEFSHPTYKWTGEKVQMEIIQDGKFEMCRIILENATRLKGFHVLGKVASKYKTRVKVGESRSMRVFTTKIGREATGDKSTYEVALIDPDASETRIGEILHDNRRKRNNRETDSPY
jgi:DNA alkylation damage repair protein AlkB